MKTSELEEALSGEKSWKQFSENHQAEKMRLLSRRDGAATSGDLQLSFDSGEVTVTGEQVIKLCNAVLENEIDITDAMLIATTLALSGFEFSSEDVEDAILLLSMPEQSEAPLTIERAHSALRTMQNV